MFDNGRSVRIWGSPMSPKNGNWAFQYPRSENVWKSIPDGIDVPSLTPRREHTWTARTWAAHTS